MAQQNISVGVTPDDGLGDTLRAAFVKTEANFTDLYTNKAASTHNHDGSYSALGHNHAGVYSVVAHDHDANYSALGHGHSALPPAGGAQDYVLSKASASDYDYAWVAQTGGSGTDVALDLGNDASDESAALARIATTGDTNNIFTEPSPDKLLIDVSKAWPTASTATNTGLVRLAVRNDTGAQLSKGDAVYINGYSSGAGLPTVAKAKADSTATMPVVGLVEANISAGADGYVVTQGKLSGVNTASYTAGNILYPSPSTAGTLTATRPTTSTHEVQVIGMVTHANASGSIMVFGGAQRVQSPLSISPTLLQATATARILGRNTAGAGAVEELDAATVRTMLNVADGAAAYAASAVSEKTDTGNIVSGDATKLLIGNKATPFTLTLPASFTTIGQHVDVVNIGAGALTISAGADGINVAGTDTIVLHQHMAARIWYAAASDPKWRAEIKTTTALGNSQLLGTSTAGAPTAFDMKGAITGSLHGVTDNDTYVISYKTPFALTLDSVDCQTQAGTCAIQVRDDGSAVTGFSTPVAQTTANKNTAVAAAIAKGSKIDIVISGASSLDGLNYSLNVTRTGN